MDELERIAELEAFITSLIDLLATGELETSFDGETVKFADATEIAKRIRLLRSEIARLQAVVDGRVHRRTRAVKVRVQGDY